MSWTVDVPVKIDDTHPATPELRSLNLVIGDAASGSSAVLDLGVIGEDGLWHPAENIEVLRLTDSPPQAGETPLAGPPIEPPGQGGTPPGQEKKGDEMVAAVLTAKIDGSTELAVQFGIPNGTPLAEALPQIGWGLMYGT